MLDWWSRVFGRWNFTENRRETMPKGRQDQVGGDGGLSILKNKKSLSCYIRHQPNKKKKGKNSERWRRNELRYLPQTDNIQLIQPIKLWRLLPPPLENPSAIHSSMLTTTSTRRSTVSAHFSLSPRSPSSERERESWELIFQPSIMPVHLSLRIASNWSDISMPCRCDVRNETPHLSPKTTTL